MESRRPSLARQPQHNRHQAAINSPIYASLASVRAGRNSNGISVDSSTMWWDDERIDAAVTREFVLAQLRPDEQERLDAPLGFGESLTDDTYWEWIESKAKRIFLILVDLGVPDQIFGVIDDSWDDDDLPVPLDQVDRLRLTFNKDEKFEKRFFIKQFDYLLRYLLKGETVYYDDAEVVPLEPAEKRAVGAVAGLAHGNIDRVHLPGRPDDLFLRRRIPLGISPGHMPQEEFLSSVQRMQVIEHNHLTSLWASYVHRGSGYLILTPVHETTIKSFLTITPPSIKILAKRDRRILLLNWIHCLADAISFLHEQGISHGNIKPSNIMLDPDNNIFLGDTGIFPDSTVTGEKRGFDKETYDYSAPEQARAPAAATILLPVSRPAATRRNPGPGALASTSTVALLTPGASSTDSSSSTNTSDPKASNDPQKADIFSLGAIFLEILTFLMKRASRNFASHRSSKNKTPGRGGGLPDSSFHKNLSQVQVWMNTLAKESGKKEDRLFRGVSHILSLCTEMLSPYPDDRPTASHVQRRLHTILTHNCGLGAGSEGQASAIHCESRCPGFGELATDLDQLRLESQRAAAAACASVNPLATEMRIMALGNGGMICGIEKKDLAINTQRWGSSTSPPSPTSSMSPSPMSPSSLRGPPSFMSQPSSMSRRGTDDHSSLLTKATSSSGGKSRSGHSVINRSRKVQPRARAHEAPVYASSYLLSATEHRTRSNINVNSFFLWLNPKPKTSNCQVRREDHTKQKNQENRIFYSSVTTETLYHAVFYLPHIISHFSPAEVLKT